jgi:HlyD family secretion protein
MILAGAGAIAGGGGVVKYWRAARPAALVYRTATVDNGPIVARVTAIGTLSAHVTVQVGAQVSGRLSEVLVDFNSTVQKGQVIARLDPALFEAALASARASAHQGLGLLDQSRATLARDRKLAERAKSLHAEALLSEQDYDNAIAQLDVDQAAVEAQKGAVEQGRAQEHQAAINLAYCTIVAPIDGTVISRNVDVGQTVAASLQAPTLFTVAQDLHEIQLDTSVAEGDVGKLRDGLEASFVVDAYPSDPFTGVIQQVRNAATTVQNVVTYDAVIAVENPDLKLRPGMTANATIVYNRREDTLRVPNAALRFRPPAGSGSAPPGSDRSQNGLADASPKTVWAMRGAKPVQVQVKTGITDGSFTEVVSGALQEGDVVVVEATSADEPASVASSQLPGMHR